MEFDRTSGHLATDFANTVSERHTDAPKEHLATFDDLVAFGEQTEIVTTAARIVDQNF